MIGLLLFYGLLALTPTSTEAFGKYIEREARPGDGVWTLLDRYHLADHFCNSDEFYRLNGLKKGAVIMKGKSYKLPILIYTYNGRSIRSTLGISDYQQALRIQKYNERILRESRRKTDYRKSKILWVPFHELNCKTPADNHKIAAVKKKEYNLPLLGKKESRVTVKSDRLNDQVYYIIAGHGGPDPGAVSKIGKTLICEDEYAYDVSLRLFKLLIEHGARAHLIIEDQNDGIRDQALLPCDQDEKCRNAKIPLNQTKRLQQRVHEVNSLYQANRKKGYKNHTCISIHVDSRSKNHRQDVFFCYYPTSKSGKKLAQNMLNTFTNKYKKHRRGGHYAGEIDARDNLYVLRHTSPKTILVELANIQNKADHKRIVQASNRQALANWMMEGLIADL